jgi:hypothetical protein
VFSKAEKAISLTEWGSNTTARKNSQNEKQSEPTTLTPLGTKTDHSEDQPQNASDSMQPSFDGAWNTTSWRDLHAKKQPDQRISRSVGRQMDDSDEQ